MRARTVLGVALVAACGRWASPGERRAVADGMVRVAAIQCYSRMGETEYNRKLLTALIAKAAERQAKILVLPECAVHGYMNPARDHVWSKKPTYKGELPVEKVAETVPGPSTRYFARLAKRYGIYLVVPLVEVADGRFYNTQVLLAPNGNILLRHRKWSLWPPGDAAWASEGKTPVQVATTPYGRLGLMICHDVHVLPSKLKEAKADIVLYSLGWYSPNSDMWFRDIFPRRYVVPNGFAVVGANWCADRGGPAWPGQGHSFVFGRDGSLLAMARTTRGAAIVLGDIPIRRQPRGPQDGEALRPGRAGPKRRAASP